MRGHLGAALTTGLAAVAVALALFQAAVLTRGAVKREASTGQSNRYSSPGGRAGIPWVPADKAPDKPAPLPEDPEGRSPQRRQQEEHHAPPPSRLRGTPPRAGPQPVRKAAA